MAKCIKELEIVEETNRQGALSLLSLPSDVLLLCIAFYLKKWDRYQLLSTYKPCYPWLVETRTICITDKVPTLDDMIKDKRLSNAYLWERFVKGDQQRVLKSVGCFPANVPDFRRTLLRKIRLKISTNVFKLYKEVVLTIAEYLSELNIVSYYNTTAYDHIIENPTKLVIERCLESSTLQNNDGESDPLLYTSFSLIPNLMDTTSSSSSRDTTAKERFAISALRSLLSSNSPRFPAFSRGINPGSPFSSSTIVLRRPGCRLARQQQQQQQQQQQVEY